MICFDDKFEVVKVYLNLIGISFINYDMNKDYQDFPNYIFLVSLS